MSGCDGEPDCHCPECRCQCIHCKEPDYRVELAEYEDHGDAIVVSADYARGRADTKREAIALVEGYREHALPGAERQTLNLLLADLERLR